MSKYKTALLACSLMLSCGYVGTPTYILRGPEPYFIKDNKTTEAVAQVNLHKILARNCDTFTLESDFVYCKKANVLHPNENGMKDAELDSKMADITSVGWSVNLVFMYTKYGQQWMRFKDNEEAKRFVDSLDTYLSARQERIKQQNNETND